MLPRIKFCMARSLTVVISQSRLAPCPTKHKLPWSLQLFHGNTIVINTANNRSNPFYVSPLSVGKDSIAPSPWTCAHYRAWKETVTEIALPSAWKFWWDQRKEEAPKHSTLPSVLLLKQKDCCCVYKTWNTKKCNCTEPDQGVQTAQQSMSLMLSESLSPRQPKVSRGLVLAVVIHVRFCRPGAWLSRGNSWRTVLQIGLFPSPVSWVAQLVIHARKEQLQHWVLIYHRFALLSFTPVQIRANTRTEPHHPHLVAFSSHFA